MTPSDPDRGPNSSYDEVDPPDPQPETTAGLEPGGSVTPGDTPPIESSTSATHTRQPELPSERTNWLVLGGLALVAVLVALLLAVRYL